MLVTEFWGPQTLEGFVKGTTGSLKEGQLKLILKQILEGLVHIHSKDIAHRDLKLDNILVDGDLRIKLIDFNVAKRIDPDLGCAIGVTGDLRFQSPEMVDNSPYTTKTDIWSAGVVLYSLASEGLLPFPQPKQLNSDDSHQKYTVNTQ
jgi:serine/threonine protein kinase